MEHTLGLLQKAHQGDKAAREQLVKENLGLVFCVVKRFNGRGTETEDLIQIGSIGLLKAIDRFDMEYDVKFSTYAVPMIAGEIRRFLRDDGMIKVSRALKETAYKTSLAREKLEHEMGREPTVEEVASEVGISAEDVLLAMESSAEIESLQKPIYQSEGTDIYLQDRLEEKVNRSEEIINRMFLCGLLKSLDQDEYELIRMRYFEGKTQSEIAGLMSMTQVQVSRMEKKILEKMRKKV